MSITKKKVGRPTKSKQEVLESKIERLLSANMREILNDIQFEHKKRTGQTLILEVIAKKLNISLASITNYKKGKTIANGLIMSLFILKYQVSVEKFFIGLDMIIN